jgi:hypothetical protein
MPGANDEPGLLKEDRAAHLDEDNNDGGRRCDGRGGVQRNAEGAMVGVRGRRMDVHNLADSQQGKQEQAQHRDRDGEPARPGGPVPAWLECNQTFVPVAFSGYTSFGCPAWWEVSNK